MTDYDHKYMCLQIAIQALELSSEVKKPAEAVLELAKLIYVWVKE